MDDELRTFVRSRAEETCEYCRLEQSLLPTRAFHIEHIIPKKHGGTDIEANLALACHRCNLHKGTNLTGIDPETGEITTLFNPRNDTWNEHFRFQGPLVAGLTPVGRATVAVLMMNSMRRVQLRSKLRGGGYFE